MFLNYLMLIAAMAGIVDTGGPCALSDEYKELRIEVWNRLNQDREECRSAVSADRYWRAAATCVEAGAGEGIGGGCIHIAMLAVSKREDELDPAAHCEVFAPSTEELQSTLEVLMEERNITKHSSSQPDGCRTPASQAPLN